MKALQDAIYARLNEQPALTGKVDYFTAKVDKPMPYLEYWTGDGTRSEDGGFREDARDWRIYIQASSRNADEASTLYEAAEAALGYKTLDVAGWNQRSKIVWENEIDDPADMTTDNQLVYYEGGVFKIALYRQRTD